MEVIQSLVENRLEILLIADAAFLQYPKNTAQRLA
jgi:hypothetical protein